MKLSLNFRNLLPDIVVEELDALIGKILGGWAIEHTEDGAHKDLTADSAMVSGLVRVGRGTLAPQGPLFTRGVEVTYDSTKSEGNDLGLSSNVTQFTATTGGPQGVEGYLRTAHDSGTVALPISVIGNYEHSGAGTVTEARGFQTSMFVNRDSNGTVTTATGLFIDLQGRQSGGVGSGAMTTATGIKITHGSTGLTNAVGINQTTTTATNSFQGYLGIGASSSNSYRLYVKQGSESVGVRVERATASGAVIVQWSDGVTSSSTIEQSTSGNLDYKSASTARFYTAGTQRAQISSSGLSVNTTSTGGRVHVLQGAESVGLRVERASGDGAVVVQMSDGVTFASTIQQDTSGNLELRPATALETTAKWFRMDETSATSPGTGDLSDGAQVALYMKGNLFILAYNDGGTMRYKYLDLTGTGVTWVHTTTPP